MRQTKNWNTSENMSGEIFACLLEILPKECASPHLWAQAMK